MKNPLYWVIASMLLLFGCSCEPEDRTLVIGGGPTGGTFQGVAQALARAVQEPRANIHLKVQPSGGSISNLISLSRGEIDFGLVFAGDAFLGQKGRLPEVQPAAKKIRMVCRLYNASGQLVVTRDEQFHTPFDLVGKRVAIGNPGSGTALAAQRYFSSLGIWERIIPIHVGFSMGLEEMQLGRVQAVWLLVGVPNQSLSLAAEKHPLRLLDLNTDNSRDFFHQYSFYRMGEIPAKTHVGQDEPVQTFQDSVLLLTRLDVPEAKVFALLEALVKKNGLQEMIREHPLGDGLLVAGDFPGGLAPLHGGAARFWRGRGK